MSLSATDFAFVSGLVRKEAAIILGPGKEYLVEARLAALARNNGAASVPEYIARIQRSGDPKVAEAITDALTTNETSWFRDREPFAALNDAVLPELVSTRAANRHLRIWSAACSSGQEPYSLAITLEQFLPAGWTYEIIATDISREMLTRATDGAFSQVEVNRGLPANLLVHYFEREGAHWRISPSIRRSVTFKRVNLAGTLPPLPMFDVIFLRNVLIYFDVETKAEVLTKVGRSLRPNGYLFLGAAETTMGVHEGYERVPVGRSYAYRLRKAAPVGTAGKG